MKNQTIADRIREIMVDNGWTQKDLAENLGISQPAVSLYLQGRKPPVDIMFELAKLAHTTVDWLLTGENKTDSELVVKEKSSSYGNKYVLLKLWQQIPHSIQRDILVLLRHIVEQQKH
jgi:transcriptional regulator with XRE-family HTH domain